MRHIAQLLGIGGLLLGCTEAATLEVVVETAGLPRETGDLVESIHVTVLTGMMGSRQIACDDLLGASHPFDPAAVATLVVQHEETVGPVGQPQPVELNGVPRVVVLARATDAACGLVAEGCAVAALEPGEREVLIVALHAVSPTLPCPAGQACSEGTCGPCTSDSGCDDGDPCTLDSRDVDSGLCGSTPGSPDADGDGHDDSACGTGDDCDDSSASVYPGAARRCGLGLDHDCNGIVDDTEGCGTCAGATGLVHRDGATVATPAVGVFSLGPDAEGGEQELFVAAPSEIQVYSLPAGGAPTLEATSPFSGVTPSPPVAVGGHLLVADVEGDGAVMVFSIDDLRAGDAVPEVTVGEALGPLSAFTADARTLYANEGSGSGALATASVTSLPDLAEPEVVLASGEWGNCRALARDGTHAGGWLVGCLGQSASWARLGPTGELLEGGTARITEGFGSDVALSAGRVLLAQGDRGLMVVDLERLSAGTGCCSLGDLTSLALPVGCSGADCRNAVAVAVASEDRAVVMGFTNSGEQRLILYLIDISDVTAMRVVAEAPLSNAAAQGRDLFVSGGVVFAAGRVGTTSEGVLDLFDLTCP